MEIREHKNDNYHVLRLQNELAKQLIEETIQHLKIYI